MEHPRLRRDVTDVSYDYPEKVLQIGEGNFIRAFADWMIHQCNKQGLFKGTVVATQPREKGALKIKTLADQDGLFTLIERGLKQNQPFENTQVIASISKVINPYVEWQQFLCLADNPNIEWIISNTTEAGIRYVEETLDWKKPIHSFPGKIAALLYRRYQSPHRDKGFNILPCELLERAGDELQAIVLRHSDDWQLEADFKRWVQEQNVFLNSLVDRIVTGYPADEIHAIERQLGYTDKMLTVAEPYHQWVIEGNDDIAEQLPFHKAGLNVEWVKDISPYVKRKVRVLNGAHTFMVPIAYLNGIDIVRDAVSDSKVRSKVMCFLEEVVAPTLPFSEDELNVYIAQTVERFENPYIDHQLLDIALNMISKFTSRIYPTLIDFVQVHGHVPDVLTESMAYLVRYYRCERDTEDWRGWRYVNGTVEYYPLRDDEDVLVAFQHAWGMFEKGGRLRPVVETILSNEKVWGCSFERDLHGTWSDLVDHVTLHLEQIIQNEKAGL